MEDKKDDTFLPSHEEQKESFFDNTEPKVVNDFHAHHAESAVTHKNGLSGLLRNKAVFGILAILFLGAVAGTWFVFNKNTTSPVTQNDAEQRTLLGVAVTLIDGTSSFSTDGKTWSTLSKETTLQEGDWIQTEAASRVILTLDDGSVIRLDESSSMSLSDLSADHIVITNESGKVYSRVVTSERDFIVAVDEINYIAQGTAYLTVNSSENKGVQVLQSAVKIEESETEISEGKQYYKVHSSADYKEKVTDISVDELKSSSFMTWNLEQDKQSEDFKDKLGYLAKIEEEPAPAPAPAPAYASIKLSGKVIEGKGISLSWKVSSIGSVDGFKVVRSKKTTTPIFGKDEANYASGSSTRSLIWKDGSGVTYNYRVCAYKNKSCSVYSNSISLTSPHIAPEAVVSGAVTLSLSGNDASWTFAGTAPHGFKVVIDDQTNPTYGNSLKNIYVGSSPYSLNEAANVLGSGTYYIRVCKYTADSSISGGCTDYSNEKTWIVP